MERADALAGLDVHDLAKLAVQKHLLDPAVEGRIAQNMADRQAASALPCRIAQQEKIVLVVDQRLFQQHIIALLQKRKRGLQMVLIHRCVDHAVGNAPLLQNVLHIPIALRRRNIKVRLHIRQPDRIRVDGRNDLHLFQKMNSRLTIGRGAVAAADHNRSKHDANSLYHSNSDAWPGILLV